MQAVIVRKSFKKSRKITKTADVVIGISIRAIDAAPIGGRDRFRFILHSIRRPNYRLDSLILPLIVGDDLC